MKRTLCAEIILMSTIASALIGQQPSPSASAAEFDVIIRAGTVYDGTGDEPKHVDVAIRGDRIAGVGDFETAKANTIVDANGLAVAPGFINMLSWSTESLIEDGRSQSEIRQGVTTEIMGEGESMGPVNDRIREHMLREQKDIHYEIKWNTLAEYLRYLEARGVSCNVASFIGATTIREYVIGFEDKAPTAQQLDQMRELVRKEMEAGALGIGTSLIYPPAFYAKTDELIELCKVAAKYQGKYISHMRSEGNRLLEAVDELITISREAKLPAEIYHMKSAGRENWPKEEAMIARIDAARAAGQRITANMYTYNAGATGLDAASAPEGVFLKSSTHPREYGNFANLLGRYVRDEKLIPLQEAVRRLTSLPASNIHAADRGSLKAGYFADVVIFDPNTIAAHATYEKPM